MNAYSLSSNPSAINVRWFLSIGLVLLVIVIDQALKFYVKTHFSLHEEVEITSWFRLHFTENKGMAFGMDFIGTAFLTTFRLLVIGFFVWGLIKAQKQLLPMGFIACLSLIVAGALGNIIDNCFYGEIFTESLLWGSPASLTAFGEGYGAFLEGKVVDMFYFPLFTWPESIPFVGGDIFFGAIFNFADAAISCGAVALILFYYKYITHLTDSNPTIDA